LKECSVFKGDVPCLVPDLWGAKTCLKDPSYEFDLLRASVMRGIRELQDKKGSQAGQPIHLSLHPTNVYTGPNAKKGELNLLPTVCLKDIVKTATDYQARVGKQVVYLRRPLQPSTPDVARWQTPACPFFWVASTDNPDEANVHIKYEQAPSGGVFIPIITNQKGIPQGTKLLLLKRERAPEVPAAPAPSTKAAAPTAHKADAPTAHKAAAPTAHKAAAPATKRARQ